MPAMKYRGDGSESYFGVPARDLTATEYDALTDDERARVDSGRLYTPVAPKREPPADAPDAAPKSDAKK